MKKFYELLKPDRYVLIRIPVAASYAWRHYGVNWVALDAPRHLFLHTVRSIRLLSKQAGFKVVDIEFDSTEFQFLGSEFYLRNIPLKDRSLYLKNPQNSIFSEKQIQEFKDKAIKLNEENDGDQACFYLYKEYSFGSRGPGFDGPHRGFSLPAFNYLLSIGVLECCSNRRIIFFQRSQNTVSPGMIMKICTLFF